MSENDNAENRDATPEPIPFRVLINFPQGSVIVAAAEKALAEELAPEVAKLVAKALADAKAGDKRSLLDTAAMLGTISTGLLSAVVLPQAVLNLIKLIEKL